MANGTIATRTSYIDSKGQKQKGITAPMVTAVQAAETASPLRASQTDAAYAMRVTNPDAGEMAVRPGTGLYAARVQNPDTTMTKKLADSMLYVPQENGTIAGVQKATRTAEKTIQSGAASQAAAKREATKKRTDTGKAVQGEATTRAPAVATTPQTTAPAVATTPQTTAPAVVTTPQTAVSADATPKQATATKQVQSETVARTAEPNIGYEGWKATHPEAAEPAGSTQADKNAQILALEDDLKNVDTLLEQAKADNDRIYQLQLEQAKARIERQIESVNAQYDSINKQLYVDYMNRRRDLPQQLAARGYTGGLRESSLIGLETGYESNLAENERKRLEGIRELEAGGNDQALTLGIENARANKEAEDTAYSRATQLKEQLRAQQDRIDEIKRQDKATNRQEAREQIAAYLAAGAGLADIPADLLTLSGYDPSYIEQQAGAAQKKLAQQRIDAMLAAGASPKSIPAELMAQAGYDTAYLDAMATPAKSYAQKMVDSYLAAGADISQIPAELLELSGYDASYIDALTSSRTQQQAQEQVSALISAGVDVSAIPAELLAAAGYDTAYRDALTGAQGKQQAQTQIQALLTAGYELWDVPETLLRRAGYGDDAINSLRKKRTGAGNGIIYTKDGTAYNGGSSKAYSGSGGYSRTDDGTAGGFLISGAPYGGGAVDADALRESYLVQNPEYYNRLYYQTPEQAQARIDELLARGTDVSEIPQYLIDTAGYTPQETPYVYTPPKTIQQGEKLTAQGYATMAGLIQSYVQAGIMTQAQAEQAIQTDLGNRVRNGELTQDEAIGIMQAYHI